jgi:NodT family efflux transporter outer membrane factor (OMF) lipoprotein
MNRRLLIFILVFLSGCAVGPDFKRPHMSETDRYTKDDLQPETAQVFMKGQDIPGQWWEIFHSAALNKMIAEALKNNPDMDSAQAALRGARENVYGQEGAYYPAVSGNFTPSRQKTPALLQPVPNSGALVYNLYTAQVNVSYAPDIFGLYRRTTESLKAQAESQRFALEATYLTLTSNVVATAIQEASLREQIDATRKIIDSEAELLNLSRHQEQLGQISGLEVAGQETALAQTQQALPVLQKQLAISRDQLTALLGRLPASEPSEMFYLSDLRLPEALPLSLPSRLVEQRPDVRAAEENLHAASAGVGIAIANRLPNITLDAATGSSALMLGNLFGAGTGFWSLTGGITQPIFDGGTLMHKERAARAQMDQAAAQYKSTVIAAFQNVADTLHALEADTNTVKAALNAEHASKHSLDLIHTQLQAGSVAYISVLSAEQSYQQAVISRIQAETGRFTDTAALFQALGGGWWNRDNTTPLSGGIH